MPNAAALVWYRELQQAFAGKSTIQDALAAVQQAAGPARSLDRSRPPRRAPTRAVACPSEVHRPATAPGGVEVGSHLRAPGAGGRARSSSSTRSARSSSTPSRAGTGYGDATFIGLRNFEFLLQDPTFLNALRNNLFFALSVPVQLVVPLVLAFLIHERVPGWRVYRWTYFLPAIYSIVVLGVLARLVLQVDGPLNQALEALGLGGLQREWLGDSSTAMPAILLVFMWANFGYNVVIYLAGHERHRPAAARGCPYRRRQPAPDPAPRLRARPAPRDGDRAGHEHRQRLRLHVRVRLHHHQRRTGLLHLCGRVHDLQNAFTSSDLATPVPWAWP